MLRLESGSELPPEQMLVLACDLPNVSRADRLTQVARNSGALIVKYGLELFSIPDISSQEISEIAADNKMEWIADLKLEGTEKTLPVAIKNYMRLKHRPVGITVCMQSGREPLRIAQQIAGKKSVALFGVGLLSSIDEEETKLYYKMSPRQIMLAEGSRGVDAGITGMVTSAVELPLLKSYNHTKRLFTLVVGTRSRGVVIEGDDQKRTNSIFAVTAAGADLVEIGREVTLHKSTPQMLKALKIAQKDVADGLEARKR